MFHNLTIGGWIGEIAYAIGVPTFYRRGRAVFRTESLEKNYLISDGRNLLFIDGMRLTLIILSLMFRILYLFFDTSLIENSIELDPIL